MDSILISIKKPLGLDASYDAFDADLIMNINAAFMTVAQLGAGPSGGFLISDESQSWSEFSCDPTLNEAVRQYIYLKTRLVFDPPSNSFVTESIKNQITELEWRINSWVETFGGENTYE